MVEFSQSTAAVVKDMKERAADFAARIHRDHPGLATSYFRSTGEKNSRENQSEIQQLLMGHLQ